MNNEERDSKIIDIHTAVMVMAEKVDNHDNSLYGNGQPGLVNDVTLLKDRQDHCPARQANTLGGKRLGVAYVMMVIGLIMATVSIIGMWMK